MTTRAHRRPDPPPLRPVPAAPPVTYAKARVEAKPDRTEPHDLGWLPTEGWFCQTCQNTTCTHIQTAREALATDGATRRNPR